MSGTKLIGAACEVADLDQVQAVWNAAAEAFGGVDIWINNAGIANVMQDFDAIDKQEYDNVVATNIIADKVETVTPWLVEATLADYGKHGSRIAWLTTRGSMGRFFKAFVLRQKRDLFAELDV